MPPNSTTAALILAAGSSSRMSDGQHKLLLPLGDRPVLAHVIDAALASQAHPILIVLGHQAEQVRSHISTYREQPDIILVENSNYQQGMSTSITTGIRTLLTEKSPTYTTPDSVLILLGDQPLMTPHILDTLIATRHTTGKPIIAPLYHGRRGNPILFAASLFPELLQVSGDEGGRSVVEQHRQEVATVELGDSRATYDVDTWAEYQRVVEEWQQQGLS
jgi:molybdenum cofactor cytidylyltransferase